MDERAHGMDKSILQSPKIVVIMSLMLILITLGLYNPISRSPFLNYDDDYYIIQNSHVRSGLSWETVSWAFQTTQLSNWHPLTWLSHALDVQLFGMNPAGHHYVNVLFHTLNVVLLFLFLKLATNRVWPSFAAALLFAVHPVNVESVAWISERKNVLSMAFFLLGLIAYVQYAWKPSILRYLEVAACFALGLMTKPQVITFPFVLLLLDYWPLQRMSPRANTSAEPSSPTRRPFSWLLLEKLPLLALSAASAVITMRVQTTAIHLEYPFSVRFANAVLAYARYVKSALWPHNLAPLYPHPGYSVSGANAILAALALLGITALVVARSRRPYLVVGWLWFVGTLVPMIGFVQVGVQAMADRYAYIPFVGLFIMLSWGLADAWLSWRVPSVVVPCAGTVVFLALTFACSNQIAYWLDNRLLWTHTLQVTGDNYIAEDNLAMALIAERDLEAAVQHFQRAVSINPKDPVGTLNLGVYAQEHGDFQAAIRSYSEVLQLTRNPQLATSALANRGSAFYALKRYDQAGQDYEEALRRSPDNSGAFFGLGLLAQKAGDYPRAAAQYARAVELQPSAVGFLMLAQALQGEGRVEAAHSAHSQAERISPDLAPALAQVRQLLAD